MRRRHQRQFQLGTIGKKGQSAIYSKKVAICGLGATGGSIAEQLARAGASLSLIDRDFVESHNLQRQTLFDASDAAEVRSKARAAKQRLSVIDPELELRAFAHDLCADNAIKLLRNHDLVIDGSDSFETRYVINDACLELKIPWIYTSAVRHGGMFASFPAAGRPCFRCFQASAPPGDSIETCAQAGIIMPASSAVASFASAIALQILVEEQPDHAFWQLGRLDSSDASLRTEPKPRMR